MRGLGCLVTLLVLHCVDSHQERSHAVDNPVAEVWRALARSGSNLEEHDWHPETVLPAFPITTLS